MGRLLLTGAALCLATAFFSQMDADWLTYLSPPMGNFNGQVVWITGASSGIGASLTRDLVRNGARVVMSARRVGALQEVAASCQGEHKPYVLPLDVTDYAAQQSALDEILSHFGRIDSIVLNAGRSQRAVAADTSFEDTKSLFDLNVFAVIHLAKLVLPHFFEQKQGQFVVVSSVSGFLGTPIGSSYSATKFALHGYFDALRAELADANISVTLVCPGPVESEIAKHTIRSPTDPVQDEGGKMPTERCSALMAKAMYHNLSEVWIGEQPLLSIMYIAKYAPALTRQMMRISGPARAKSLKTGGSIFDLKSNLLNVKK